MAKHERKDSRSAICVVCLVGILVSAMSLGGLRLYGLYLEHRLTDVTARIESMDNKNAILEERHSALLSPSRIYMYAKAELKMVAASDIETITLNEDRDRGIQVVHLNDEEAESVKTPNGFMSFFIGRANAKD